MKTPALCRSAPGRQRGRKVYSLHVPEVECIGKGKTRVNGRRRESQRHPAHSARFGPEIFTPCRNRPHMRACQAVPR